MNRPPNTSPMQASHTALSCSMLGNVPRREGFARAMLLLLALLMLTVAGRARADCEFTNSPGTVAFSPPATITLPTNPAVGTVLWTSAPVVPAGFPTLTCVDTTNSGIQNINAGPPTGSDDTLFPTNVPGLSYRLLHPDTTKPLQAYPNETIPAGTFQFSVASALQLVVTGSIANGSVFSGGLLAQWSVNMCDLNGNRSKCKRSRGANPVETFSTSSIRFLAPPCVVVIDPTVVTLPTVFTSNFSGVGSTSGQTAFNVQLTCYGADVSITLATSSPAPGLSNAGVIAPTTGGGFATNVGVQVLDNNGNPIAFSAAMHIGVTPNGAFSIPLQARYYQTGTPVSAGQVTATATYTLTYQ